MLDTMARGMNVYYRGYVIHKELHQFRYTIYDRRPERVELAAADTTQEAMRWIDARINIEARLSDTGVSLQELLDLARAGVLA